MPLVFLVDDHEDTRELLVEWLRMQDFDVVAFADAEAALAAMKTQTPDALVTDLMLDGMSGLDLLEKVRAEPAWRGMPIVACTGRTDSSNLTAGFARVLVKPIVPDVLSALLRDLVAKK
jgi:CheY-like chemotaxis protein